jgi:hypothetical protein
MSFPIGSCAGRNAGTLQRFLAGVAHPISACPCARSRRCGFYDTIGQHTGEVLREAGYGEAELADMRAVKVV